MGGILTAGAVFAGALAAFAPTASAGGALYAVEAGDHGPGGWAGAALFQGGTAIGSGNTAGPGGAPAHITFTSWNPDAVPGWLDVNFTSGGLPGCVVVPVTHGAEQPSYLYFFGCDFNEGLLVDPGIPGKATPTG